VTLQVSALLSQSSHKLFLACLGRWQEADRAERHVLDRKAWCLVPPGFLLLSASGTENGRAAELPQIWLQVLTQPSFAAFTNCD
jgi:hypothetical protein